MKRSEETGGRHGWDGALSYSRQRSLAELEQRRETSRSSEKGVPLGLKEYVCNFFVATALRPYLTLFPTGSANPLMGKS